MCFGGHLSPALGHIVLAVISLIVLYNCTTLNIAHPHYCTLFAKALRPDEFRVMAEGKDRERESPPLSQQDRRTEHLAEQMLLLSRAMLGPETLFFSSASVAVPLLLPCLDSGFDSL